MSSLIGIFVVGSIGFWILLALAWVVVTALIEFERPWLAGLSLVATFVLVSWLGNFNLIAASRAHPLTAAVGLAAYFLAGAAWSVWKFYVYFKTKRDKYEELKRDFLDAKKIKGSAIPTEMLREWYRWLHSRAHDSGLRECLDFSGGGYDADTGTGDLRCRFTRPRVRDNKKRILTWMLYWPWSLLWYAVNDPVRKAFEFLFNRLKAVYQWVLDRAFAGMDDDFREPPDKAAPPPPPQPALPSPGEDAAFVRPGRPRPPGLVRPLGDDEGKGNAK